MKKYETPAETGELQKPYTGNIPDEQTPVKPSANDNLLILHNALSSLAPAEYKNTMSAVCQYLAEGTIPASDGYLKVIISLAIALLDTRNNAPRRRGGQAGNRNAAKKQPPNESESEKTNRNESKTNRNESTGTTVIPVAVASTVTPSVPVAVAPSNLNFKNNKFINYLNCENENELQRRNRIKNNLRRFGFTLADKTVGNLISSVPDTIWLVEGYDFPSYLAKYVTDKYKNKGKSRLELQKLYLSAWNPDKWSEPWSIYPNWLSEQMEQVLVDKEILRRKTPPQKHCPDCGANTMLNGLKCPKCGGFYQWDESAKCHVFVHHLEFSMNEKLEQIIAEKERQKREAKNADTLR